jgi:hypothetical protein
MDQPVALGSGSTSAIYVTANVDQPVAEPRPNGGWSI